MKDDIRKLQDDIAAWSRETFGGGDRLAGMHAHLKREVVELGETFELFGLHVGDAAIEIADCCLLLFDMADQCGRDIGADMRQKLEVNKRRKWGKPNPDGSVEHVRGEG